MEADTGRSGQAGEAAQPRPETNTSADPSAGTEGLEAQLTDMRDRWMRAEAEVVNVGIRAKRDLENAKRYAVQTFATDVVEAAENLRRGLDSIPAASASEPEVVGRLREGFLGVERAFIALLKRNGIVRVDPIGQAFDPALHQAMSQAPAGASRPGTVLRALSAAWTLNDRLLRPAMVVVAGSTADTPGPKAPDS